MKLISKLWVLMAVLPFVFVSCEDDTPSEPLKKEDAKEYSLSRKTNYGNDWIYFSFETGKEVEGITEENRSERLDWDVAFNKAHMRTNSGKSGKGKGGAIATDAKSFEALANIPQEGYQVDGIIQITKDLSSFPPPQMETPGNAVLEQAVKFSGPPPLYTISENVFVIKTAKGKFVKFKVLDFYNKEGKSGYLTFQYEKVAG